MSVVFEGDRTRIVQLMSVRSALRMEAAGMQSRRALRPMWAEKLELPKKAPHAVYIERCTELIERFNQDPSALRTWGEGFE